MDIYGIFQYRNIEDTSAPRSNCDRFLWARKREMEALLEAASEDTREDPDFDDPDDLDFNLDQEKVMRAAYAVFENEVSGMDHKMIAAHYASLFADLSAEAAGNATSNRSSKLKHVGETSLAARAATSEKKFLNEEAEGMSRRGWRMKGSSIP